MSSIINTVFRYLNKFINIVLGSLLGAMLVITFLQVLKRYMLNNPWIWAEELTLILLIWYGYLLVATLVDSDGHISLEFLYLKLNDFMKKIVDIIKWLVLIIFAIFMVKLGGELIGNANEKYLPATKLPRVILYYPMLISGVLIILYSFKNLLFMNKTIKH